MTGWTLQEVLEATAAQSTSFAISTEQVFDSVSTDTRTLSPGGLFVPLVGAQHDGHDHVLAALQQGARACLWSRPGELPEPLRQAPLLRVHDTLQALQELGRYHLRRVGCKVVAITGSTGKTTTKDLVASLLQTRYRVHKTPGNFNNEVGVPLTLLQLSGDTQVAVLELAMRGEHQIAPLTRLTEPQVGVITNIGVSHIELLGSRQAIARAKGELFEQMASTSLSVVPRDSDFFDYLWGVCQGPRLSFSGDPSSPAEVRPRSRQQRGLEGWRLDFEGVLWEFPLPGEHHVEDLAAAWAVARHLGVTSEEAAQAARQVKLSHLRMERQDLGNGLCLLNDAYNAAPDSMRSALKVLAYAPGRKVAVLGDMLELGDYEEQAHRELGEWAAQLQVDFLLAVGPRSQRAAATAERAGLRSVLWAADVEQAAKLLIPHLQRGDTLLLKASRGVGLDRLVNSLESWQSDT